MKGEASAPASSANLGPGFDTLALGLDIRCVARAEPSSEWSIISDGVDPGPEAAAFVMSAATAAADRPFRIEVTSDIPRASGLGSSAAVAAAVSAAALRTTGTEPDRDQLFGIVADLEGHYDNAAATVYGGLVSVVNGTVLHLEMSESLVSVVAVPAARLRTTAARDALPEQVSHAAAARNAARVVALVEGLRTADPAALAAAAGDELHESHRMSLSPATQALMRAAAAAGALHVAWSGAGPSVLALTTADRTGDVVAAFNAALEHPATVLTPGIDRAGLR